MRAILVTAALAVSGCGLSGGPQPASGPPAPTPPASPLAPDAPPAIRDANDPPPPAPDADPAVTPGEADAGEQPADPG